MKEAPILSISGIGFDAGAYYQYFNSEKKDLPLILALHGFGQSLKSFCRLFKGDSLVLNYRWLFIQAPLPVMLESSGQFKTGYAWYSFDSQSKRYLTPISSSVQFCLEILQALSLTQNVERILGYSQGGYVAPYLAHELDSVRQVLGIHCRFREEDIAKFKAKTHYRLDALHGAQDPIVDPIRSQDSHRMFIEAGFSGEFTLLQNIEHELSQRVLGYIGEKLLVPVKN